MLNQEINAGLADPKMKARLADLGGTVLAGSPADFGERCHADLQHKAPANDNQLTMFPLFAK